MEAPIVASNAFDALLRRRVRLSPDREVSVREVIAVLERSGIETLLSGGAVRDCLNGETPVDADLTALAPVADIRRVLAAAFGSDAIAAFWPRVGTVILGDRADAYLDVGMSLDWRSVEGATSILDVDFGYSPSLESDILTRDFCCNALYWSRARSLVDITGRGRRDAEARRLSICMAPEKIAIDPRLTLRIALFRARGYRPDAHALAHFRGAVDRDVEAIGGALAACLDEMARSRPALKRQLVAALAELGASSSTIAAAKRATAKPASRGNYILPEQ